MSYGEPLTMFLNYLPRLLHLLVLAALLVGIIVGMTRRSHWSFVLMLCGVCLALLASIGLTATSMYVRQMMEARAMREYGIISFGFSCLSVLGDAIFAAGFIVRMAVSRRQIAPSVVLA